MSVVKINAINVPEGAGPELEKRFAARAHTVDSSPGFEGIENATKKDIVGKVYDEIEARVKPQPARRRKGG